ncbi:MAG: RecB family exonuclease, partial [Candidatus Rifleibacteriota bacterium]
MADKPDLFSKLFRSTKKNLKNQKQEKKSKPGNKQALGGSPKEKLDKKSAPAKIKIPLSGGKIDLYQTCPRKFYYTYIKKLRTNSAPGAHLCFDQSLHKALTDFYRDKNKEEPFKLEKLGKFLAKNWDNRGYKDKEQELEFKNIAVAAMKNYFNKYCQKPPRHIETDYFFKVDLFGSEYSGKIDRVDELPDGSIEL